MAVFPDAVGPGGLYSSPYISSPVATVSWTHPKGSGSQKALVVPLVYEVDGASLGGLTRTCSWAGNAMTSLGTPQPYGGSAWLEFFGLLNVPSVAGSVVANVSGQLFAGRALRGVSMSYSGVDSFGTYTVATGTGTALAVAGTAALSSLVVGAFGTQSGLAGFTPTPTLRYGNNSAIALMMGDAAGTGSASNFAATRAKSGSWAGATVVLNAADVTLTGSPVEADPTFSPGIIRRLPRPGTNRRVVFNLEPDN